MPVFAEPFRFRVIQAITVALEEITIANGYSFDMVNSVFRGRSVFGEGDPLPMISILERAELPDSSQFTPARSGLFSGNWDLVIQGFTEIGSVHTVDDAYFLAADITKRLALAVQDMNETGTFLGFKSFESVEVNPAVVRPPDEISSKSYSWQILRLHTVENLATPYDDA